MKKLTSSSVEVREIAVAAEAHPRTVMRRISGQTVKGLSAQRIDRVLLANGWVQTGEEWQKQVALKIQE